MSNPPPIQPNSLPPNKPLTPSYLLNKTNHNTYHDSTQPSIHTPANPKNIHLYQNNSRSLHTLQASLTGTNSLLPLLATILEITSTKQPSLSPEFHTQHRYLARIQHQTIELTSDIPLNPGDKVSLIPHTPARWLLDNPHDASLKLYRWLHNHHQPLSYLLNTLYRFRHDILSVLAHSPQPNAYSQPLLQMRPLIDDILSHIIVIKQLSARTIQHHLQHSGLWTQSRLANSLANGQNHEHRDLQTQLLHLNKQIHTHQQRWHAYQTELMSRNGALQTKPSSSESRVQHSPLFPKELHHLAKQFYPTGATHPLKTMSDLKTASSPIDALLQLLRSQIERGINRIHHNQLASLLQNTPSVFSSQDNTVAKPTSALCWEIPIYAEGHICTAKLLINDESDNTPHNKDKTINKKRWRFVLNFNLQPFGDLYAQGLLVDKTLKLTFCSTQTRLKTLIQQNSHLFIRALKKSGLQINDTIEHTLLNNTHELSNKYEVIGPSASLSAIQQDWITERAYRHI